ncbi:MAG: aconitase X catalytic domain-containing protein [Thermomicrobiales bacterium]|nr:aconitase X catalytic domain-containing protein [Thermomicrobiales bacterium]
MDLQIRLSDEERAMLAGEVGPATQLAASILRRMAPIYGATSLLPVSRAHIDGVIYTGRAGLHFAEHLADLGGKVAVVTTLNVGSVDRERWRNLGQAPEFAAAARRLGEAYLRMGAQPTFTCAPYQQGHAPAFGEQIAWSESNAVAYANSILGARTNRYGDYLDICCAITGRVPAAGLHLDENRRATCLITLQDVPEHLQGRDDFYPVLGYALGERVPGEVAAVAGLSTQPTTDQLKALCAAAASSGDVALLHLIGVTPEAPTQAAAFGNRPPARTLTLSRDDLRAARRALSSAAGDDVDVVAFGSPHCSLGECRQLAALMQGQRAAPGVQVFVTTSRAVRQILARNGDLAVLEAFGAEVTADTCIVVAPLVKPGARVLMTNSAKYAHYGPGLLGVGSVFGSAEECVESAVRGRVVRDESAWN